MNLTPFVLFCSSFVLLIQQRVESMEIDHVRVAQVGAKQEFGMRVSNHVCEHDVVYKLAPTG